MHRARGVPPSEDAFGPGMHGVSPGHTPYRGPCSGTPGAFVTIHLEGPNSTGVHRTPPPASSLRPLGKLSSWFGALGASQPANLCSQGSAEQHNTRDTQAPAHVRTHVCHTAT